MKKLFSLCCVLLFLAPSMITYAQPLQDFEAVTFPPSGWTLQFTGTQYWTRSSPPGAYNTSTASAKFNFFSASGGTVQSLITPTLIASVAGDSVKFDQSYHTYETEVDSLIIETSIDNGTSWTVLQALAGGPVVGTGMVTWAASLSSAPPTLASQWATRTYALPVGTNKIRFRSVSAFGNNLYVDNVRTRAASGALANDVGVTAINFPPDLLDTKTVTPCATIRNFGTANQLTPFNVTATISPGGYSSTVTDTVSANLSNQVCFANFIPASDTQTYTVTIYTQLGSDGNRNNDTLRITRKFPKTNSSYDPIWPYYGANSMAPLGAPPQAQSRPNFCWKDTTGSISLIINKVNQGTLFGSLDDGHYRLRIKNILAALNQDTNRLVKIAGVCYDSIMPGTNGVIGFSATSSGLLNTFTIDTGSAAYDALFPLWKDNNFAYLGTGAGTNRLSIKASENQLIVTYDRAPAFSDTSMWVSHQTVIELVSSCSDPNSNFRYTYADTTTGQTSGAFVNNYVNSFNTSLPAGTTFFNHFVGYSGPLPNTMFVFRGYMSTANPFAGTNPIDVKRSIYNLTTKRGLAVEFGPDPLSLGSHDCVQLTVRLTLEGLQSNVSPRARDTVDVEVRDASVAPYKLMQRSRVLLDSTVNQKGIRTLETSILKRGNPYYIVIRHRNSIRSWSTSITPTGSSLTYDFTGLQSSTFGGNSVFVNGNWSFYTGDVTQDGIVDGTDVSLIDNDAFGFVSGDYVNTDLNWDGIVDGSDASLGDNNASVFVSEVAPPGALRPALEPIVDYTNKNVIASEAIIIPDVNAVPKSEKTSSKISIRK